MITRSKRKAPDEFDLDNESEADNSTAAPKGDEIGPVSEVVTSIWRSLKS